MASPQSQQQQQQAQPSGAPPGVNMPRKKDPRMRQYKQQGTNNPSSSKDTSNKEFFDSATYEVQKHLAKNDKATKAALREKATSQPHVLHYVEGNQ